MNKVRNLTRYIVYLTIVLPITISGQSLRWSFISDGSAHQDDEVYKVIYAPDGYVYAVGYQTNASTGKDITVMKFSAAGDHQWSYSSNETGDDIGYDIIYGGDNLYVTGYVTGGNMKDFLVLSVDTSGSERWLWSSDGPLHQDDEAYSIVYNDGYVYAVGYQTDVGTGKNTTVMALDSSGVHQWSFRTYETGDDIGYDIIYDGDELLYVAGYANGGNMKDFLVLSVDTSGSGRWLSSSDGPAHQDDEAYSIVCNAGYVYAAGYQTCASTGEDITVMKFSAAGGHQWSYRSYWPGDDVGRAIVYGDDNNLYVGGYSTDNGKDYAVLSINPDVGIAESKAESISVRDLDATIFCGPLLLPIGKRCRVFDIAGRVVEPGRIAPGVYFVEIDNKIAQKVVKIR